MKQRRLRTLHGLQAIWLFFRDALPFRGDALELGWFRLEKLQLMNTPPNTLPTGVRVIFGFGDYVNGNGLGAIIGYADKTNGLKPMIYGFRGGMPPIQVHSRLEDSLESPRRPQSDKAAHHHCAAVPRGHKTVRQTCSLAVSTKGYH
jgi:hypothetical protein